MKKVFPFFVICLLPVAGFAHDGHGIFRGDELGHYFSSPGHFLPILAVVALLAFGFFRNRAAARRTQDK